MAFRLKPERRGPMCCSYFLSGVSLVLSVLLVNISGFSYGLMARISMAPSPPSTSLGNTSEPSKEDESAWSSELVNASEKVDVRGSKFRGCDREDFHISKDYNAVVLGVGDVSCARAWLFLLPKLNLHSVEILSCHPAAVSSP